MNRAPIVGSASMVGREITRQWRVTGWGAVTSARSGECDLPYDLASMSRPSVSDVARLMIGAWKSDLEGVHALTSPEFATYRQIAMMAYEVFGAGGRVADASEMKPFCSAIYPPASQKVWVLLGGERISMRATLEGINAAGTDNRFGTA